jgi:hypothetical protein
MIILAFITTDAAFETLVDVDWCDYRLDKASDSYENIEKEFIANSVLPRSDRLLQALKPPPSITTRVRFFT